ncbi:hypothetical protein QQF64_008936 [Cirrhinus molitorella]|uniref:Immunoglobulin domain-containing protein n=1 Tax=Cirrhinus molitorella TaxID=172907 RepID=A0ABR3M7M6_9TELE
MINKQGGIFLWFLSIPQQRTTEKGVLLYDALGWEVRMPKNIHGLKGSCLVIPCSFNYTSNAPKNPHRVVWYQYASHSYPLVYDPLHPKNVINKFRGKTSLYKNSSNDCSLLIKNLELSHHGEKLYTWIDPENVGKSTYQFYEVTSTIQVDTSPQQPSISTYGGEKTGDTIIVVCSTIHTCPYSKPNITLNGIEGTDEIDNEHFKDGQWKISLTRTAVVKAEHLTIQCLVTHLGGITVTATKDESAKCAHHNISIEPELADVTEGIAKNFICSVYHSCKNQNPNITWNYENMQVTEWNKTFSGLDQVTFSNITFLGATEDHGKKLICTAKFYGRNIMASVVLNVQSLFHHEADPMFIELKTIGLYILTPSLVFLLACIIAAVIIYKKQQRSKDAMSTTTNKPFSKPRMPSPKSDPKSHSGHDYEAEYTNMEELNMLFFSVHYRGTLRRNMKASFYLLFQGILLYDALGWEVRMPKDIHGLRGSCLVIPCSFNYTSNPPKDPHRVVWYQWVSKGYPLVYDRLHPNNVIENFRGKTDLYGDPSSWDCSLLIKNLEKSHHGEKLYAWIDPENVGWRTYKFYDVTTTIQVDASPQMPMINISGGEWTGENITVVCSTFHTCPYSKPKFDLNGIKGSDKTKDEPVKDGLWKTTLTRTGVVKAENSTIECSVTHHGGITVTATKNMSAQSDPVITGLETIGLYILAPSLVFLLACIAGVIIYKKRQRSVPRSEDTMSGNKSFSKTCMPSPKSDPKSCSENIYEAEYTNMDELNMYENI